MIVVLCVVLGGGTAALAADAGDAQRRAAAQAAPAASPAPKPADPAALAERVVALEKENVVLREDLGKARLDVRTALNELNKQHAEEMARLQQRIDELNAQLAADREKESQRARNTWIALGLLALGMVAAN
jgi:hypothetical protein